MGNAPMASGVREHPGTIQVQPRLQFTGRLTPPARHSYCGTLGNSTKLSFDSCSPLGSFCRVHTSITDISSS